MLGGEFVSGDVVVVDVGENQEIIFRKVGSAEPVDTGHPVEANQAEVQTT